MKRRRLIHPNSLRFSRLHRFSRLISKNFNTRMADDASSFTDGNGYKTCFTFTTAMEEALLDAMLIQHQNGLKQNGAFTTEAYHNVVKILQDKFGPFITKDRVQNRYKKLKSNFAKCYDFWKDGMSGFAWNPVTKLWSAEPKVWQALVKEKPAAVEWMNKPVPHYDKLVILYGNDRATGEDSCTARDAINRRSFHSIDEIDDLVSQQQINLENDYLSNEDVPESSSQRRTQRNKKGKTAKSDDVDGLVSKAVESMVQAIDRGTTSFEKVMRRLPISEGVWPLLEEIGLEQNVMTETYYNLISNPEKLQAVLGCPAHKRYDLVKYITGRYAP